MKLRIGHGYDVHKLAPDRKLIIGCVEIPYEKGLLGHSDADVLSHAIADALLGAAGKRDIGFYFPDSDPQYRGMSGTFLLSEVKKMIQQDNYVICNIDCTLIAQEPKISPHIFQMRKNVAAALNVSSEDINIKATTEEKLGFTGKKEGISAHAVCLIEKI